MLLFLLLVVSAAALDNGLARTPPMGWMSWSAFYCQTDCAKYPDGCINQQLYQQMADRLVSDGYRDVGYNRIHVDDCWLSMSRNTDGSLAANSSRFPDGMDGLAAYMHQRQLYFGIYEDVGSKTCAGYPGSEGHYEIDANTFAKWQCDYLKFDGCHYTPSQGDIGYPQMSRALNASGRPMIYSCEWPLYLEKHQKEINYTEIAQTCNLWRNYNDVSNHWKSIHDIIKFYHKWQDRLATVHGPGAFNDPDMIVAGNNGVSFDQARVQLTVWSIWSAPLILSNDLRKLTDQYKQLIQNKDVIAVDQDPLAIMGKVVIEASNNELLLYTKPMTPLAGKAYSYAIAAVNTSGTLKHSINVSLQQLGLNNTAGYTVKDLWAGTSLGTMKPSDILKISNIPTTGAMMYKATALS